MYLPWEAKYISVCLQSDSNSQKIISPSGGERLEFLHGAELQIQKNSHWLSLFDTFLKFPKIIIVLHLELEKHTCRWHFSACPPPESGNERSLRQLFVSCLYFCTPISLPGSWGAGMKFGYLSIGGMQDYDKTVGLCPSTSSYTSRAHPARPHNENALEPHGHDFISSQVCGNQLASCLTSAQPPWWLNQVFSCFLGEFWNASVYSQIIQRHFAWKSRRRLLHISSVFSFIFVNQGVPCLPTGSEIWFCLLGTFDCSPCATFITPLVPLWKRTHLYLSKSFLYLRFAEICDNHRHCVFTNSLILRTTRQVKY